MMTSYFNLLKYAATGIASPDMTYYDRMRASTLMGGTTVQTLTGIPPLSFKSDGTPLISWSMKGNGSQTGTPTPDNPIMPTFCGVRTGNLFPLDATKLHVGRIENDGTIDYDVGTITVGTNSVTYQANTTWRGFYTDYIQANENEKLTFSPTNSSDIALSCNCYDENDNFLGKAPAQSTYSTRTFTTLAETKKVRISVTSSLTEYTITNPILNSCTTALPYEPFGYKIPISCAGQTVPVYLGQVSTVRQIQKLVLTGDETISVDEYLRFSMLINNIRYYSQTRTGQSYCSHYECLYHAEPYDNNWNNVYYQSGSTLFFHDRRFTTVADFKSFLATQYSNGTPVTIWYILINTRTGTVNEPLCGIGSYADELHITSADVSIPTVSGENTLTVDTPIQPSEMTITGRIQENV